MPSELCPPFAGDRHSGHLQHSFWFLARKNCPSHSSLSLIKQWDLL